MSDSLKYWQDLACANRKVAEDAQAQRDKAREDAPEEHIKEVRLEAHNAALERAATLCDEYAEAGVTGAMVCAAAIRAMKVEK